MGFIWKKILWPALKGVAKLLTATVKWSFTNPTASLGIGLGVIVAARFVRHPWLASTLDWVGGIMISASISGFIFDEGLAAAKAVADVASSPFRAGLQTLKSSTEEIASGVVGLSGRIGTALDPASSLLSAFLSP